MKINSSISRWFFVFLMLFVTNTTHAEDLATLMLIDGWKELAKTRTQKAGKQIFEEAMTEANAIRDEDPDKAAMFFFTAAGLCRDLNDVKHAIPLFKEAIELKPDNAHYRRVYGDYLLGYRGLEEQAWSQLYKSRDLVEKYPGSVDQDFEKVLNRSIHIFRRDTRDGALTFERNQSDGALIFENKNFTITGGLDARYSKQAKDPLDLSTDHHRASDVVKRIEQETLADDLRLENLLVENGGTVFSRDELLDVGTLPDGSPITINNLQARNARARSTAQSQLSNLERQTESVETFVSFLLRTPNSNLPTVRLSYFNTYAFEGSLNADDLGNPYDRVEDIFALELERTFIVRNDLFLEADLALLHRNQQIRNDDFGVEDDSFLDLVGGANIRKEWGTSDGIVQLNVGGQYRRDLFDFEAYPRHEEGIRLRNSSFFADPSDNTARERFRGRRSSSQEIGAIRSEIREGTSPTVATEDWRFFVSNEELGLIEGMWDLYTTYSLRQRDLSEGTGKGTYSIHEFRVEPIWVPIFDLYKNDFIDGWEFFQVGFPVAVDIGDGPYDRVVGGVNFRGQYVVSQAKLTLGISAGVEYAEYTDINEGDFGGFIRFSIF